MKTLIRILHLEDSPRDAEIIRDKLEAAGLACEVTHVKNKREFESALDEFRFDLIVCDYNLPDYDGSEALAQARVRQPDVPIVIISAWLTSEKAVECLHQGATDYLLKDRIERLPAAVRRALDEAEERRQRRDVEEELRLKSEMMANLADGVYLIRASDGLILRANPQFERMFGYAPGELIGKHISVLNAPADKNPEATAAEIMATLKANRSWQGEIKNVKKDGTPFWCYATVSTFEHRTHGTVWVASHRDITRRKVAAEALTRKTHELSQFVEQATVGIHWVGPDGIIQLVNRAELEILGYTREEVIGHHLAEFHEDPATIHDFLDRLSRGDTVHEHAARLRCKDGSIKDVLIDSNVFWEDGKFIHSRCFTRDITERKRAEQALRESEARFRAVAENLGDGLMLTDLDDTILDVNPRLTQMTGYARDELVGRHAYEVLVDASQVEEVKRHNADRVDSYEMKIRRKDGSVFEADITGAPLRNEIGEIFGTVAVFRDIAARKNTERQMLRMQRLESIGTLASGVAHDLNNTLAPILMATELLRMKYSTETKMIDTVATAAKRGADMVRQLLTFAKGVEGARLLVQPRHLLKEMEKIIKATFPKNIQLRIEFPRDLRTVLGDATQLHQVLLNLCVNARDAMPNGGTLTLEAENAEIDATYASAAPEAKPGSYVVWRVKDSGTGIPPEIIDRIFEPFFTTKGPDKGTGLGLSTVLGIVRSHGGFVRVYSPPGQGTTFAVYLPAGEAHAAPEAALKTEGGFRGHGETILVVDDEDPVREITGTVLTALNFKVLTAADGTEALVKVAEHRAELRAIITDLHMPHLDGLSFVRVLRHILPQASVIVASGRLEEREKKQFEALNVSALLDKPFTQEKLIGALKTVFQKK